MNFLPDRSLLRVALPSIATAQQPSRNSATEGTTTAQLSTSKRASLLEVARNKLRNQHATDAGKGPQLHDQNREGVVAYPELASLVRFCGEAYGFTEEDHAEALSYALADHDSALTCFRAIKAQILAERKRQYELPEND